MSQGDNHDVAQSRRATIDDAGGVQTPADQADHNVAVRLESGPDGGLQLVEVSALGEDRYEVTMAVCQSPVCGCRSVDLSWGDDLPGSSGQRRARVDISDLKVEPSAATLRPEEAALATFLANGLTEPIQRRLTATFVSRKRELMASVDPEECARLLPSEIFDSGVLVAYTDVFPCSATLELEHDGVRWIVVDQYCLDLDCPCTEILLAFYPSSPPTDAPAEAEDGAPRPPLSQSFALRYDPGLRTWTAEDVVAPMNEEGIANTVHALEAAHPDLRDVLMDRRKQLRKIAAAARPKPPRPVRSAPKIGRNEPCPCGSGRKFKRCCGRPAE
jgi:hypothetical protein